MKARKIYDELKDGNIKKFGTDDNIIYVTGTFITDDDFLVEVTLKGDKDQFDELENDKDELIEKLKKRKYWCPCNDHERGFNSGIALAIDFIKDSEDSTVGEMTYKLKLDTSDFKEKLKELGELMKIIKGKGENDQR